MKLERSAGINARQSTCFLVTSFSSRPAPTGIAVARFSMRTKVLSKRVVAFERRARRYTFPTRSFFREKDQRSIPRAEILSQLKRPEDNVKHRYAFSSQYLTATIIISK